MNTQRKKLFIFNFENTLLNTRALNPYLTNQRGISYLLNNLNSVQTQEIGDMKNILKMISSLDNCLIKSRFLPDDTNILLAKHGLKSDIHVFEHLNEINYPKEDTILITDSSTDILEAQNLNISTLGVGFGENTQTQLLKAGASIVTSDPNSIYETLIRFKNNEFGFKKREFQSDLKMITDSSHINPEMEISSLQDYIPYNRDKSRFYSSNSDQILSFKRMKNFTFDEINKGATDDYYYNGINQGNQFLGLWWNFFNNLEHKINTLNLTGKTIVCGVPNSLPEFCYRTDINEVTANQLNEKLSNQKLEQRLLERINPIDSAHNTGIRNSTMQYQTIAFRKSQIDSGIQNIILFDDITTSGNQLTTAGNIVRKGLNFNGNLYGITLGKTN